MTAIAACMTSDEFLELPEEETYGKELINGEVVDMGKKDNRILVLAAAKQGLYGVMMEALFQPGHDNTTGVKPDVTIVPASPPNAPNRERIDPVLAVEVVSSERARRLHEKVEIYFGMGAQAVWALYSADHMIEVHTPDGSARKLRRTDWVELPGVIPDFRVWVDDFFQGID